MQPMYRPSMPPHGMRPPGVPPPGSLPPSGLPPPQRPPAGYRPSFSGGSFPPSHPSGIPSAPPSGLIGNVSSPMIKPPVNPPVQKMANLTLDSNSSQQLLSNGLPDIDSSALHSSQSAFNGSESINSTSFSNNQINEPRTLSVSPFSGLPSSISSDLQQKYEKDSLQEHFPSSHSPSLNQVPPSSTPNSNIFSQAAAFGHANFDSGMSSFDSGNVNPSQVPTSTMMDIHQNSGMPPSNVSGRINASSPQPGISSNSSRMMTTQPGMHFSVSSQSSHIEPSGSNTSHSGMQFGAPRPSIAPGNVQAGSFVPGMPPPVSPMGPPRPGMPPMGMTRPGMPPLSSQDGSAMPGMPPLSSQMGSPMPGMPPLSSQMGSPMPGMPPLGSQMGSPMPGMNPLGSQMGPPKSGMPPMSSQIGPPKPGMPPFGSQMDPSKPGMLPLGSQMGPPRPGMPPVNPQIGSPRFSMPPPLSSSSNIPPPLPSSFSMSPQTDMYAQKPGMPPPPPTASYMPSPGGIPPPGLNSQMGVPPTSSNMNQLPAPGIGGMQNRYPGTSTAGSPMGGYPQGNQGRRLNPDDMPSPLQVIEEDRHTKSGEFITTLKGGLPPLVTTDFIVKDGGNASPRFIRSTMYSIPATQDMMKQSSIPFGLVINPLADLHPNEAPIYMGTSLANGPVRCNRCKGYMSPLMMFMDGGRRFQCLLCKQINEVPADYYCHMDGQGARADKFQRPELCLGTYEFAATAEYCKDKVLPKEPAFIFVFEMSQMMVQRGIINLLCQNMKSLLQHLPIDEIPGQEMTKSSMRVGFITYDSSVHFYKLTGLAPEMCIVCDKENMFVPVPDGVLCDVEEVSANIDKLMESIPQNFQTTRETSGILYSAIQAGMSALKASGRAGKLFVFHSSLPQIEGIGKLKGREDRKVLGTDKEKAVLSPQNANYNNLAQDLVSAGCGVDLYLFNESYIDLATIGQVAKLTGGQCYKYTFFQTNKDADRLLDDLRININRNIAFESVMRVRTSTGVRPVEFFGHFFMSNTHDIELSVIDSSKAVVVEVKHDDKITEEDGVYIQVALLYTSVGGQRRLRILNLALSICNQMAELYKNCELDTLMNYFGKHSMFKFLEISAKQVRENLVSRSAQILACYRKNCASPSSAGQLILPELMKLLPLYINSLTKCDALSGGQDLTCDDRSWHIYQLSTMPVEASVVYFYPRLIPLTEIDPEEVDIPAPVRSSYEKLSPDGVYLLENGLFMFMWVGSGTSPAWMKDVFGVSAPHQLDPVLAELPDIENSVSKRVRSIIDAIREQRKLHVRLFVVPQQGKHEVVMRNYLVEDKGIYGAPSYVDFLCHVHKEIRALLS